MSIYKLCYIRDNIAYFTTQELSEQTGDDWEDIPYQHNAGEPYAPGLLWFADGHTEKVERDWNPDGSAKWQLVKIAYDSGWTLLLPGQYVTEDTGIQNEYSLDQITAREVPWLYDPDSKRSLYAGATIDEFIEYVEFHDGQVYLPRLHPVLREYANKECIKRNDKGNMIYRKYPDGDEYWFQYDENNQCTHIHGKTLNGWEEWKEFVNGRWTYHKTSDGHEWRAS